MATKPTATQEATALYAAAGVIAADGLAKGAFMNPAGCRCTAGALSEAVTGNPVPPEDIAAVPLLDSLLHLVSEAVVSNVADEDPIERIADWSDAPDRTAAEVAQLLRRLAGLLLEQHHQIDDPVVMDYTVRMPAPSLGSAA